MLRGLLVDDDIEEAIAARRLPGSSRQLPKQLCRQGESQVRRNVLGRERGGERRTMGRGLEGMAGQRW